MKTLKIQLTATDSVTLTFSESGQEWDLFSGNVTLLDKMAQDAGWNYQECRQRLADWAAENKDLFVKEEKEQTTDELWSNENTELEIVESVDEATQIDLEIAFKTRTKATWNNPVEKYGYGCRNIDEVLTHIRYGQQNDCNPPLFKCN